MALTLVTPPTIEPVSLPALKAALRVDIADDDSLIVEMGRAAREDVEIFVARQLLPATWQLTLDAFATEILLPRPPTSAVTRIDYLDTAGALQTLATSVYQVDLLSEPARIRLAEGQSWPPLQSGTLNTVQILYVAGYANAASVPAALRAAVQMITGDLYFHREARLDIGGSLRAIGDNPTVERLLWKYRVVTF